MNEIHIKQILAKEIKEQILCRNLRAKDLVKILNLNSHESKCLIGMRYNEFKIERLEYILFSISKLDVILMEHSKWLK